MPPKTTGMANAAKSAPKKTPLVVKHLEQVKAARTTASTRSPSPVKADAASDPRKPPLAASSVPVKPPSAVTIKNIHDALTKLRADTVFSVDAKQRTENTEEEEEKQGGFGRSKGKGGKKDKKVSAGAKGSPRSNRAKEIDGLFEEGLTFQMRSFMSSSQPNSAQVS
jgi:hypothetical protein